VALGLPPAPLRDGVPLACDLARFDDAPALIAGDEVVSYAELAARVEDAARRLGSERRLVLVAGANAVEPIVAYLGALAGGHPVLLAPADRPDVLDGLVAAYDPDVVVGPAAGHGAGVTPAFEERREGSAHELHPELALLLSTSGSTGSPKLVRLSRANVQANAEAIGAYLQIRDTDRAVTTLPLHYCYGLSVIHSHLARGAALVLTELSVVDRCFWELVRRARVTSFAGVPYTFELLERVGFADMDLPHLRYVTQAGGRLAPERVAHWSAIGRERGWDLFVMYGQTEATARMAYLPPDLAGARPQAIGVPVPGGSFALEPVDGAADGVGELVYAGPNVMLGYASSPADLARGREIAALRTGDLARRGEDGLWEIVGRRSRFVKVLGLRIDLDRAETLLDARCVGRDEQLVVAIDDARDPVDVRRAAVRALGVPLAAVCVVRVAELPRLVSGKVDYGALASLAEAQPVGDAVAGERDGATTAGAAGLRALLADVLDLDPRQVRDADTFVSLGGDSLSYVQASVRIEAALGGLPAGWHVMPIGELATAVRERGGKAERRGGLFGALSLRRLETSVLLRALAIVLIVGTHAGLFALLGGAHLLVAVAGFNFARFQLGPGSRVERLRGQLASIARIAVPTVAWIAVAALLIADEYGIANVLLANAVVGPEEWSLQWHFWFVEVLLYILLALALVLAVPAADRAERRWPLAFAAAVLAAGLLGRYGLVDLGVPHTRPVLWLFALGWLAARCVAPWQRVFVTAVVLATVPGFFGDAQREVLIAGGLLLLLWAPSVPSPAALCRLAAVLAAASLYVYLTHWQVYRPLAEAPLVAVFASFAVGIAYWQLATRAGRAWGARRQRAAVAAPSPTPAAAG
jgi:acyl-CoA synthetase (AMP-forming)/AMP-acid ligase II